MSTHTTTTDGTNLAPKGYYTRYNTVADVFIYLLKHREELILGGFPKHVVTVYLDANDLFIFGLCEDEVQAQVQTTSLSLPELIETYGDASAKAKLAEISKLNIPQTSFNLRLIASLGFNI